MNPAALQRLERIAGNLPVKEVKMGKTDTSMGEVFIAWGRGRGCWHGLWGVNANGGTAQTLEIKDSASEQDVQAALQQVAHKFLMES